MSDDLRITEDGNVRITETSDSRITEQAFGEVDFQAQGSISSTGLRQVPATIAISASGSIASDGQKKKFATFAASGQGSITVVGSQTFDGQFGDANVIYYRVTENGDQRITEDGNDRIGQVVDQATAEGTLVADATKTAFASDAYVNVAGTWKEFEPFVKYDGIWYTPKIYKKVSGDWKRVF